MGNTATTESGDQGLLEQVGMDTPAIQRMDKEIRQKLHAKGVKYNMKVLVRGERKTGKSCLVRRLQGDSFEAQIQTYTIKFPGPGSVVDDESVKLEIWNVVDNADAPTLQQQSQHQGSGSAANPNRIALDAQSVDVYHDTHACLFMMDPRSKSGLDYISHILPDVPMDVSVLIIMCFRDLQSDEESAEAMLRVKSIVGECRGGGKEEEEALKQSRTVRVIEASMKDGYGLQLELENVRLEGVEKILDSKLLTSDYSQYLKEMSLDPHRHHIMEEGEPSTGGKAEGVIITGEDRPEILATAAAKSTPSPLSSHPAPSSGLAHQSSFSSQNVNTAAAASAASVGGSSSIERLVGSSSIPPSTEPHAESKRSKHKKDKKERKSSSSSSKRGGGRSSPSSRQKHKHRHRSKNSKSEKAVVNDKDSHDNNGGGGVNRGEDEEMVIQQQREPCHQSSIPTPQSSAAFPTAAAAAPTDNIERVDICTEKRREHDDSISSSSTPKLKSNQPPRPLHAPSLRHPSHMPSPSSTTTIVTDSSNNNKAEYENSIGYGEDEELVVERRQKQRSGVTEVVVVDEESLTSSSDEDDMPTFSRLKRVLATDLPCQNSGAVHFNFDRDRNISHSSSGGSNSMQMTMSTSTMEKETSPNEEKGEEDVILQSSRMKDDDVNRPADIQSRKTNVGSNNSIEEKQMEDITDEEIAESESAEMVRFEEKSDESNRSSSTFDINNTEHVAAVKEQQLVLNDEQQVVTAAVQAERKEDEGNSVELVHNDEATKNEVAAVIGGEPPKQFGVAHDKAAAATTMTIEDDENGSDTMKDFCPDIDVDADFFNSGNDDDDEDNGVKGEE